MQLLNKFKIKIKQKQKPAAVFLGQELRVRLGISPCSLYGGGLASLCEVNGCWMPRVIVISVHTLAPALTKNRKTGLAHL